MKKLLSILLLSISLIGCSKLSKSFYNGINKLASVMTLEERVLYDELTDKGTEEKPIMYFEGALFNGVGYSVYSNGQTKEEVNYKDGKEDGLQKGWFEDGQLQYESNYKDGEADGLAKGWYENGQLRAEGNFKDAKLDGLLKTWDENGQLELEVNYKDGVLIE